MPRSKRKNRPSRQDSRRKTVARMIPVLDALYRGEAWDRSRETSDVLDTVMRTIMSQNTNDENRDRGYRRLRERFSSWEAVLEADPEEVKDAIRTAGLANQKGPNMQAFLRWLKAERGKLDPGFFCELPVDEAVRVLTSHRGIGLKTAYVVLAFACDRDLCAVDTHIHRILRRVGLIDERCGREKAHLELRPLIPKGKARSFHVNLLDFGKQICTARNPSCGDCPVCRLCSYCQEGKKGAKKEA